MGLILAMSGIALKRHTELEPPIPFDSGLKYQVFSRLAGGDYYLSIRSRSYRNSAPGGQVRSSVY